MKNKVKKCGFKLDKRTLFVSFVLGAIFAIAFLIGTKIDVFSENPFENFLSSDYFFLLPLLTLCFSGIVYLIYYFSENESFCFAYGKKESPKRFLLLWLIIFICWLPYFLAFYPGVLTPDSNSSINQALGITELNNHHPVLFTLAVKLFIDLGKTIKSVNLGVGLFSLFQMLCMSAILSYGALWIYKRTNKRWIFVITACFYALNPVIALYSMTMWKDILFAGWMLLFILFIADIVISEGEILKDTKKTIFFVIISLLVSFSRNNGIYVVIFSFVFIIFFYRKILARKILVLIATVLLFFVITGPGYSLLGIKQGNFAETVGIPLQQVSYSIKNDAQLSEEQEEILSNIFPIEKYSKNYTPYSPDNIKFDDDFNDEYLDNHKVEFLKTWVSLFPSNMKSYTKAWLMQTVGYYYPGSTNWIVSYDYIPDEGIGIEYYDLIYEATGIHVRNIVETQLLESDYNILPIYNIALSVWLLAVVMGLCIIRKQYKSLLISLPLFGLWGTLMIAAPTWCEFRYMYSFHLALPLLAILMFYKTSEEKKGIFDYFKNPSRAKEIFNYLLFGVLATVVNIVSYAVITGIGVDVLIANVIAWIITVIFAYITNKYFVFKSKCDSKKSLYKEILEFFSARIATLIFEELVLLIFVEIMGLSSIVTKILAQVGVVVLNYIFSKLFIFAKGKDNDKKIGAEENEN